ncbi:MAG: hypothetical protein Q7J85_01195 [Bacillota bacterium]|nr:hypothetical protein [Bacillota bacterium]
MAVSFKYNREERAKVLAGITYQVNIPSSIALNYEQDIVFTSRDVDIAEDDRLVVSIDGDKTFPDGPFYLHCDDGSDASKRIECIINRGSSSEHLRLQYRISRTTLDPPLGNTSMQHTMQKRKPDGKMKSLKSRLPG